MAMSKQIITGISLMSQMKQLYLSHVQNWSNKKRAQIGQIETF